jgi:hypothetical protein
VQKNRHFIAFIISVIQFQIKRLFRPILILTFGIYYQIDFSVCTSQVLNLSVIPTIVIIFFPEDDLLCTETFSKCAVINKYRICVSFGDVKRCHFVDYSYRVCQKSLDKF